MIVLGIDVHDTSDAVGFAKEMRINHTDVRDAHDFVAKARPLADAVGKTAAFPAMRVTEAGEQAAETYLATLKVVERP